MANRNELPAGAVATRTVELVVALAIAAIGLLVVYDSHRVGVGWADDGPRSGYFPNIIGWILTLAGASKRGDPRPFSNRRRRFPSSPARRNFPPSR